MPVTPPCNTDWEVGDTEIEKSGAVTISVALTVRISVPLVPVIVNGYVPPATVLARLIDRFEVPVVELGLKVAVAPAGNVLVASETLAEKPLDGLIVTT